MIHTEIGLEPLICFECGIHYAVPAQFVNSKTKSDPGVFCPNGHEQFYAPSPAHDDAEKLKAYAERTEQENYELRAQLVGAKRAIEQQEAKIDQLQAELRDLKTPRTEPVATSEAMKPRRVRPRKVVQP